MPISSVSIFSYNSLRRLDCGLRDFSYWFCFWNCHGDYRIRTSSNYYYDSNQIRWQRLQYKSKVCEGLQVQEGLPSGLYGIQFSHGGKMLHEGDISQQHIFLVPEGIDLFPYLILLYLVLYFELGEKLLMQLFCLLLKMSNPCLLRVNDQTGLLYLIVYLQQLIVFLVELINVEVFIPLEIAVYLLNVFIFYYVLLQQQASYILCILKFSTNHLRCPISQQIVNHVYLLYCPPSLDVLEYDLSKVVFDLTVSHLQLFQRTDLESTSYALSYPFIRHFIVTQVYHLN